MKRATLTLVLVFWALLAAAQTYPTKPVRVIVAAGTGGGDDFVARQVAAKLGELLGQPFVVENRAGAGGMIGQMYVVKSAPDGYTLLLAGGSMAGARYVNASIGYDLARDFTPISLVEVAPFVMVVRPGFPAASASEFIAYARSQRGKLNFGTPGAGQIPYWSVVLFNSMAGIEALEVAYKSIGDVATDVIAGRLDYAFLPITAAVGNREKLRALAVTTRGRAEQLPDVPPLADTVPGYEMPSWRSFMGPAGMNPKVVEVLNRAIRQALESADLRERFFKAGSMPMASTPAELKKRYEEWSIIFGKIARDAGLQPH